MESAIKTVVSTYLKSAKGKENLSGKDFQSLVKSQLGGILNNADSSKAVKDMQQGLDDNQDGKVSFQEYMKLIGYLADSVSQQYVTDKVTKTENNDGAVTQCESETPADGEAEPAAVKAEEPATDAAAPAAEAPAAEAPAAAGEGEAEKALVEEEEEEAAVEKTAEVEKTEEEEAS